MTVDAVVSAPQPEETTPATPEGSDEPPVWLRTVAFAAAAGVLTFGVVGLVLAILSWYSAALAFSLGTVAFVAVMFLGRGAFLSPGARTKSAHTAAALGVVAILAITAWNASYSSQHVLINRDGGSYLNTGRWIARDGSLEVDANVGGFKDAPGIGFQSFAIYDMGGGKLEFQFAHMLPVVLAEAHAIGGDRAMTRAPQLLGGIALLAFFVLAWRLMRRPWFALAATLALAFVVPQVSFTRDAYSEIPSQIVLFTALWLIADTRVMPSWQRALASGLFLGALWCIRIDAIVFLIGVPVMMMITWLRADPANRSERARPAIVAFVAGLVPGLVVGGTDLIWHSGRYWGDLISEELKLIALVALSTIACALVTWQWKRISPFVTKLPWKTLSAWIAGIVIVGGFAAWAFRPNFEVSRGGADGLVTGIQTRDQLENGVAAANIVTDATRTYYERSLNWMEWYLGPLTLAAAIIGAGLLVRWMILGKRVRWIAPLAIIAPGSLLYLYKASAVPDHPWTMRRFLVSSFPTLILVALGLAAYLFSRREVWMRVVAVVVAVVAVAYPVYTVVGVHEMTEKRGFLQVVYETCDEIGPDAAVLVAAKDEPDLLESWIPHAFRSWCGATVAAASHDSQTPESIQALADAWAADGKPFFLIAKDADTVAELAPPGTPVTTTVTAVNKHALKKELTERPTSYEQEALTVSIAEIPPSG